MRVPIRTLSGIVCFGQVSCSPFLMGLCCKHGVALSFLLTEYGRFLARVQGPVSGNVLLRRQQYRCTDDPARNAAIAKAVVTGKIANCRTVLMRAVRERKEVEDAGNTSWAALRLAGAGFAIREWRGRPLLRGLEVVPVLPGRFHSKPDVRDRVTTQSSASSLFNHADSHNDYDCGTPHVCGNIARLRHEQRNLQHGARGGRAIERDLAPPVL